MRLSQAVVLLLALTACGSTVAASPSRSASPTPSATATPSALPTPTPTWPTPGPSADLSPVRGTLGPIAWRPLPFTDPVDQDATSRPDGTPPWCTAADLTITLSPWGAGGDSRYYAFSLDGRPGHRCSLQGYPSVRLSDRSASWGLLSRPSDLFRVQVGGIVDARHPGSGEFRWSQGPSCVSVDTSRRVVEIDLPHHGGRLTVDDDSPSWGECTQAERRVSPPNSGWILTEPLVADPPRIDDLATQGLEVGLPNQPGSVRAGGLLAYQIQLTGPGRIRPGTGYRERLVDFVTGATLATRAYTLNASGLPPLTRLGDLFDMEMPVPANVPAGTRVYLDWETDLPGIGLDDSGPGPVTVTAADS